MYAQNVSDHGGCARRRRSEESRRRIGEQDSFLLSRRRCDLSAGGKTKIEDIYVEAVGMDLEYGSPADNENWMRLVGQINLNFPGLRVSHFGKSKVSKAFMSSSARTALLPRT